MKHHIQEEEGEMLPKAQESEIDWEALETAVMKRRDSLMKKFSRDKKTSRAA